MSEAIKLAFVGDIMCGDSYSLAGRGSAAMIERYGERFVDEGIAQILRAHDLTLGNVECVLSDAGRKDNSLRRLHMRGRPQTCELLAAWGLTAANVANNHILEQGKVAAIDTVKNLRNAGIKVIGAGKDHHFGQGFALKRIEVKGTAVYMGGFCMRKERYAYHGGAEAEEVERAIRELKSEQPEAVVIVSVHWGNEYIDYPSLEQRQTARHLKQAGATLVIGHHPHVVQGIDRGDGTVVAYSLGNFIFDGFNAATGWSIILSITLDGGSVESVETIPIERQQDFRPAPASGKNAERYLAILARRNELCRLEMDDPAAYESAYQHTVEMLCESSRKALWRALARRFVHFRPVFWPQLLFRPVQRRLGVW